MSKLFSILFVIGLTFIAAEKGGLNADCTSIFDCDKGLDCYDYRCQPWYDGKKNEVEFFPKGPKCDIAHYCGDDYHCYKHRCETLDENNSIYDPATVATTEQKEQTTQQAKAFVQKKNRKFKK